MKLITISIIVVFLFIILLITQFLHISYYFHIFFSSTTTTDDDEDSSIVTNSHHRNLLFPASSSKILDEKTSSLLVESLKTDPNNPEEDLFSVSSLLSLSPTPKDEKNDINPLFNIKTEDDQFCQSDAANCYSDRCYSPPNYFLGGCLGSPYSISTNNNNNKLRDTHHNVGFAGNKTSQSEKRRARRNKQQKLKKPPMFLDCPNRKDEKKKIFQNNNREEGPSNNFKSKTSWMFPKWFDWKGKCDNKKSSKTDDDFIMRGFHSRKDGLYRLQNVCVQPNGTFVGYIPPKNNPKQQFEPWRGADDVYFATKRLEPSMHHYILHYDHVFRAAEKPASCYLDTKVMLFPIGARSDNIGHSLHRFGSALRGIEAAFGVDEENGKKNIDNKKDDDVTIMYLVTDGAGFDIVESNANTMNAFYEALGSSWFSVYGPQNVFSEAGPRPDRPKRYQDAVKAQPPRSARFVTKEIDLSHFACFKEIVVWQNSYISPQTGTDEYGFPSSSNSNSSSKTTTTQGVSKADIPGAQTSFHIHGPRSSRDVGTASLINQKLRLCAGLPPKRKMRNRQQDPLKILMIVRRSWRRWLLQPNMIGYLGARIEEMNVQQKSQNKKVRTPNKISLQVVELSSFQNFRELIETYSNADILIGVYGAGLTFNIFMPPGSLTIETNFPGFRYAESTGLNRNPTSEFGGTALTSASHHLVLADHGFLVRKTHYDSKPGAHDLLLGRDFVDLFLEKIQCLMLAGTNNSSSISSSSSTSSSVLEITEELVQSRLDQLTPDGAVRESTSLVAKENILPVPSPSCKAVSEFDFVNTGGRQMSENLPTVIAELGNLNLRHSEQEYPHSASRRVRSLIKFRSIVARAVQRYVEPVLFGREALTRVMIVEPCEARYSVLAESQLLRALFTKTEHVVVAEFAAGRRVCDELKRQRYLKSREGFLKKKNKNNKNRNNQKEENGNIDDDDENSLQSNSNKYHQHPTDAASDLARRKSINIFQKVSRLQDYYIRFCEYPCRSEGMFHIIFTDCYLDKDCAVNFGGPSIHDQEEEKQYYMKRKEMQSKYPHLLPLPSATEVFRTKAIGRSSILFSFQQNLDLSEKDSPTLTTDVLDASKFFDKKTGRRIFTTSSLDHDDTPVLFISRAAGAQQPKSEHQNHRQQFLSQLRRKNALEEDEEKEEKEDGTTAKKAQEDGVQGQLQDGDDGFGHHHRKIVSDERKIVERREDPRNRRRR